MNDILGIVNTGLGYIDQGLNLYNTHFGGSGGTASTPPYMTPPYVPPTASSSNGGTSSNTNTIAGISVSTIAILAVAYLLLKK